MKNFLKKFASGLLMGIGASIPGISGGTIGVITGIYEGLIKAVSNLFKTFKESIIYLLPILFGVICGFIPCIILFDKLFTGMLFAIICLFAGLIIGSFPKILNSVKGKKATKADITALIVCGVIGILIGVGSVLLNGKIDIASYISNPPVWFYFAIFPVGILASSALVVPGISGSMLLLILGFYKPLINQISSLLKGQISNVGPLIGLLASMALGIVVGFYLISKLMHVLLDKYHQTTMYGIIGFIIGSTIVLFFNNTIYDYYLKMNTPSSTSWMKWYIEVPLGIVLLIIGIVASYFAIKYATKKELEGESKDELGN